MKFSLLTLALMYSSMAFGQSSTGALPVDPSKKTVTTVTTIAADGTKTTTTTEVSESKSAVPVALPIETVSESLPESKIYNLMYMPKQGTFSGSTIFVSSSSEATIEYQSREFAKPTNETTKLSQAFGYTAWENVFLGVAVTYQLSSVDETKYGVASTLNGATAKDKKEKGLEEPLLLLKTRISDQIDGGRNIDLVFGLAPKTGNAKRSNATTEGNALLGATRFSFRTEIGKRDSTSEWFFNFGFDYVGKATSEDASNSASKIKTEDYATINGGFTYQWIINPSFLINLNGALEISGKQEALTSSNVKTEIDSSTLVKIGAEFIFTIVPKASLFIGLRGEGVGDLTAEQTNLNTGSKTNLDYTDNSAGIVTVGANYEF